MSDSSSSPSSARWKENLMVGFLKSTACLPLWLNRGLGSGVGWICYMSRNSMYRVTRENLELCFPHLEATERKRLIRASLLAK
jgi:KDO2-lipid IV(A) lauroyltransferase